MRGLIIDATGAPVAGVQVAAENIAEAVQTDASGQYVLNVPVGWSGQVVPTLDDHNFSPPAHSFVDMNDDSGDGDFLATSASANAPPTADAQTLSLDEDDSLTITLSGSDPEGGALQFSVTELPLSGTLRDEAAAYEIKAADLPYALANGNVVRYAGAADSFGADAFQFVVNDGLADSDPATVTLVVLPVNDPPSFSTPADQSGVVGVAKFVMVENVSPGPANEASQTVTLTATSSNQAVLPNANISVAGNQLALLPIAAGATTISFVATDDGGTLNGGDDSTGGTFQYSVAAGSVTISGQVRDTDGNAIAGVQISAGAGVDAVIDGRRWDLFALGTEWMVGDGYADSCELRF